MLADGVAANTGLQVLSVSHNQLHHKNGAKFMEALSNLKDLRKLCMNNCYLDTDLIEAMMEALQDNESLTEISLYTNDINA
jgi:Ran GTPase-activating protein (RanGAP) involved in mRNA processing and transport